jgi:anti-sigma B factor antagonist
MAELYRTAWSMVVPEIVTMPAQLDAATSEPAGDDLTAAISRAIVMVIADMTATTFCDSAGLRALIEAIGRASAAHVELRIVLPDGAVLRELRMMGLDHALDVYPSVGAALKR